MRTTIAAVCPDGIERQATMNANGAEPPYTSHHATVNAHGRKVAGYVVRETPTGMVQPYPDPDAFWRFYVRAGSKYAHVLNGGSNGAA